MKKILFSLALMLFCLSAFSLDKVTDSLDFAKAYAEGATDILDGQISSVNVCGTTSGVGSYKNIFIRGLNTIHGNSQPAIYLDGTLLNSSIGQNLDAFYDQPGRIYTAPLNTLGFLSMYEIESIEVIKDVSATALYGTTGANGVILINTKNTEPGKRFDWHSNGITDFRKVAQNHNFAFGYSDKGINFNISGFFRSNAAGNADNRNNTGGVGIRFGVKSNQYVWFTFNSFTSVGKQSDRALDFDDDAKDFRSVNNADLTINIAKMFRLDLKLGFDMESNNRSIWYGVGTPFGKENNGAASVLESTLFGYNAEIDFSFKRYFSDKHLVSAELFFGADGNANKFNAMCGYDFFVYDLRAKGLSIMGSDPKLHKQQRTYGEISGGLRASYSFDNKVGVDASLTVGYTPKYDENPTFYPVANVWADLHRSFFNDAKGVSSLRLTGGYGIAGREYYIPYELTPQYYTGVYPAVKSGAEPFFDSLNRLRTTEWTVGLETGFIDDRITADFKFYNRRTNDNYSMFCFGSYSDEAKLWAYTDRKTAFSNSDDIRNRGIELELAALIINRPSFKWTASISGAYNVNQIVESNGENVYGRTIVNSNSFINANVLGYSACSLIGYLEDGKGGYVDSFKDGVIDDLDKQILGSTIPAFSGSLNTVFTYKGFALEIMAKGVTGVSVANLDRMIKDGKTELSESYVEDGSYFRLGRIGLSYDIPLKSKVLKGLGVSLTGINPFTITGYSGVNPDVNSFGDSVLTMGAELGANSVYRGLLVGIKARF